VEGAVSNQTPEFGVTNNGAAFECLLRYFWNAHTDTETWMLVSHDKQWRVTFEPLGLRDAINAMIERPIEDPK
jgi:hypothetical protein